MGVAECDALENLVQVLLRTTKSSGPSVPEHSRAGLGTRGRADSITTALLAPPAVRALMTLLSLATAGQLSKWRLRSRSTYSNTRYRRFSACSTSRSLQPGAPRASQPESDGRSRQVTVARRTPRRVAEGEVMTRERRRASGGQRAGCRAPHDVHMLQLLQQRNLPDGCGRHALVLRLKTNLLQRDGVARLLVPRLVHHAVSPLPYFFLLLVLRNVTRV